MPANPHRLLLLIPAYNEERRIEPVLREYATYFQREYSGPFELIVLLNGCRDNTAGVVQRVARDLFANGSLAATVLGPSVPPIERARIDLG